MLNGHDNAVLQFSGGKDSLATLYLARPYLDRITVMFCDTGAVYPHLRMFVEQTCDRLGAKLQIVTPLMPVAEFTEVYGLPSDIVPAWTEPSVAPYLAEKPVQLIQSPMACCAKMLFEPLAAAVLASGTRLVIRGAKQADKRKGVPPGWIENGVTYTSPIWDWSDEEVFAYLAKEGAELAPHYGEVGDSLDCWLCTAHMPYGDAGKKLAYTRANYPDLWPIVQDRLKRVSDAVRRETARAVSPMTEFLS